MYAHFELPPIRSSYFEDLLDPSAPAGWPAFSIPSDFLPPFTPPPEMNGMSEAAQPGYYQQQENGLGTAGYPSGVDAYRLPPTSSFPREVSNADFGRHSKHASRTVSPFQQQRQSTIDDNQAHLQQKRASRTDMIAPSFQVPKTVNDSGGSLSELAAQITCLFWFESSNLLQQIEDSVIPLQPARPLVSDAKPTSGFRKWVTTLLSTTLVAQNVVILALLFIYRLKKLNPSVQGKPGSEYRLLTVALMLGNKFLDDNTYTNRTWAEVSGINVSEVHIMEVEFLSNMKYCLFTTAEDWSQWQALLGKFAAFFERASKPLPAALHAPLLPPASSLNFPVALPSPPASNQASPAYLADLGSNGMAYGVPAMAGPSPAPSPHVFSAHDAVNRPNLRKRSRDEHAVEPPPKRQASSYPEWQAPHQYAMPQSGQVLPQLPRPMLPSLASQSVSNPSSGMLHSGGPLSQQLPPLAVPGRAMGLVYPSASSLPQVQQLVNSSQTQSQMQSQCSSRQQSPYATSRTGSPLGGVAQTASSLYPAVQISPTYLSMQRRDSPYRPVHNVATLLHPPPSSTLEHRAQNMESNQMYYQPLGKPQQRQTGRLPYVSQNMWLDGDGHLPETMTPVQQWPSFINTNHYQQLVSQQ